MQRLVSELRAFFSQSTLPYDFRRLVIQFYENPDILWEQVGLQTGNTYFLLKNDPNRLLVADRMVYIDRSLKKLWTRIVSDRKNHADRGPELELLGQCLDPQDGFSHIAQKPSGGYDVRAYAHESWIFLEIPTFAAVESGSDGTNTTEERRRKTIIRIVLHELAHIAGYWEHDDKHADCILWLSRYLE